MSMFENYDNQPDDYIPNNLFRFIDKCPKIIDLNLPNKEFNVKNEFIAYTWKYGDTFNFVFSNTKDIYVERDSIILEEEGAEPTDASRVCQKAYNIVDLRSWTCTSHTKDGDLWEEDAVFTYTTCKHGKKVSVKLFDMPNKTITWSIQNYRHDEIYSKEVVTNDAVGESIEFVIDKEMSTEMLKPGVFFFLFTVSDDDGNVRAFESYLVNVK